MGSIDTLMQGSPASGDGAADWLASLEIAIGAGGEHTLSSRYLSSRIWSGRAADGYRGFAADVVTAHDEAEGRSRSAAGTFRSYALQLRWRQEDMATHRSDAATGGLVVDGTLIHEPSPLVCPSPPGDDATPNEMGRYDAAAPRYVAAVQQMDLFRRISGRAQGTFERLDDWIVDYLVPEEEQVKVPSLAGVVAAAARSSPDFVVTSSEVKFSRLSEDVDAAARSRAVGEAAEGWAYEEFVPQATREMVDEGLRDAGSAVGGFFTRLVGG